MKRTKRTLTGIAFTAMLALSLIAAGGDADASTKRGGPAQFQTSSQVDDKFIRSLGVTWE